MSIWSIEIKELGHLYKLSQGSFPELEKEMERLIATNDENMLLVYSRRCLEVVITYVCKKELNRDRGTEPLQRIIDRLNKEGAVPHNIIVAMQSVNSMSTFGAHPKDFELKQVKPVLSNLETIIGWYFKYRNIESGIIQLKDAKKIGKVGYKKSRSKRRGLKIAGAVMLVSIVVTALIIFDFIKIESRKKSKLIDSIMILPFDNLTGDENMEIYVSGMHSSLIKNIGGINGLRVLGKTSAVFCKNAKISIPEIASEFNVDAVIEAEVMLYLGDSIKVQFRLIRTSPEEKLLWEGSYKEERSEIFNLYNEVTKKIADEVEVKLTNQELETLNKSKTVDKMALDAYMQAQYYWGQLTEESLNISEDYYNKAIDIEPQWAPPYAGLAMVWIGRLQMGSALPGQASPIIVENINKALDLDPDYPDSHFVNAQYSFQTEWNWEKSARAFEKALKINPSNAGYEAFYAHLLLVQKKHFEAQLHAQKALELDPLDPLIQALCAVVFWHNGNCESAIELAEKVVSLVPDHPIANGILFMANYSCGNLEESLHYFIKTQTFDQNTKASVQKAFEEQGYTAAFEKLVSMVEEDPERFHIRSMDLALYYAIAKKFDKALDYFEKSYEEHDPQIYYINVRAVNDGFLYPIKYNPRFIEIVKKLNLPLENVSDP